MKQLFCVLLFLSRPLFADITIYDLTTKITISYGTLIDKIAPEGTILLGEFHNREKIQNFQADFIRKHTKAHNMTGKVTLAWEFLDYTDQNKIETNFLKFQNEEITGANLMSLLFSTSKDPMQNIQYLAPITAIAEVEGQLIGVNAPRAYKTELRLKGIDGVDPKILPSNMRLGTGLYLERFREAMGGHSPEDQVMAYFLTQSYTDCVMAYQLDAFASHPLRYFILGSFHSDYFDGTTREVQSISSLPLTTLKILEKGDLEEGALDQMVRGDAKYGPVANYLIIID